VITMLNRSRVALLLVLTAWGGGRALAQGPEAGGEDPAAMSTQTLLGESTASIDRMREMLEQIKDLQKKAEDRSDTDAIQCVRDKRASASAMVDVAVLARNTMQEALASAQVARAGSEFRKITVAEGMVDQFLVQAMACLNDKSDTTNEVVRNASGGTSKKSDDLEDFAVDIGAEGQAGSPYK